MDGMSSITNLPGSFVQSILQGALQGASSKTSQASPLASSSLNPSPDSDAISPFGKLVLAFRQLQQSNPAQYQQVTAQIATKLQTASSAAQANGNSNAAAELQKLSADFSTASQTGQLPNFPDLGKVLVAHHHHSRYEASSSATASATQTQSLNSAAQTGSASATQTLLNTLASVGISF